MHSRKCQTATASRVQPEELTVGLARPLHYDTNHVSTTQLCYEKVAFPTTFSKSLTTIVTAPVRNAG